MDATVLTNEEMISTDTQINGHQDKLGMKKVYDLSGIRKMCVSSLDCKGTLASVNGKEIQYYTVLRMDGWNVAEINGRVHKV